MMTVMKQLLVGISNFRRLFVISQGTNGENGGHDEGLLGAVEGQLPFSLL